MLRIKHHAANRSVCAARFFPFRVRLDFTFPPVCLKFGQRPSQLAKCATVGQFASGQARPIECVIIDEGFGSLDKDGLRAAAEELTRLKRHLKRIILVSHQDEFTDHFPVVIQLSKTPDGVTATTVRR